MYHALLSARRQYKANWAADRTARMWKVVEETQLVFRLSSAEKKPIPGVDPKSLAAAGSVDRVAMLDDELFVTGADDGSITLWSTQKKKPLFIVPRAHGIDPPLDISKASAERDPDRSVIPPPQPRWITALRAIPYSDVVISGSWDGYVRIWQLSDDKKKLKAVGTLGGGVTGESSVTRTNGENGGKPDDNDPPEQGEDEGAQGGTTIRGVVNDIAVFERGDRGKDGLCVVVAVGKEHRLGRWMTVPKARNGAVVFEVPRVPRPMKTNGEVNGVHDASDEG